jgi:hypothetical protein
MKLYILFLILLIILFFIVFFIKSKEGYTEPSIIDLNTQCNGSQLYSYKNNGLNRWYTNTDVSNILTNIINTSFDLNKCLIVNPLKRFHKKDQIPNSQSIEKVPFGNTNLSVDNIRLMDACDFYSGYNPITQQKCIETFINDLEKDYTKEYQKQLSYDDKIYLTICSALFVGLIFSLSQKYNI